MKNKLIILVVLLSGLTFLFFYFGLQDRLGLRKNSININIKGLESMSEDRVKVALIFGSDTITSTTYYSNTIATIDWYGQDYIELRYKNMKEKIKFKEFKKRSWEKYNCDININYNEKDIVISWNISTLWESNKGLYVFPITQNIKTQ